MVEVVELTNRTQGIALRDVILVCIILVITSGSVFLLDPRASVKMLKTM